MPTFSSFYLSPLKLGRQTASRPDGLSFGHLLTKGQAKEPPPVFPLSSNVKMYLKLRQISTMEGIKERAGCSLFNLRPALADHLLVIRSRRVRQKNRPLVLEPSPCLTLVLVGQRNRPRCMEVLNNLDVLPYDCSLSFLCGKYFFLAAFMVDHTTTIMPTASIMANISFGSSVPKHFSYHIITAVIAATIP